MAAECEAPKEEKKPKAEANKKEKSEVKSKHANEKGLARATLATEEENPVGAMLHPGKLLRKKVSVNGQTTSAVIDTGAVVSAITPAFVQEIEADIEPWREGAIVMADGRKTMPAGTVQVEVSNGIREKLLHRWFGPL